MKSSSLLQSGNHRQLWTFYSSVLWLTFPDTHIRIGRTQRSTYGILTSELPRCEPKTIAVEFLWIAADFGFKTRIKLGAKCCRSSDDDKNLSYSNRKIDSCEARICAELLGEYIRFPYLYTKLQLHAFFEKSWFDISKLFSMKIQHRRHQNAGPWKIRSRLLKTQLETSIWKNLTGRNTITKVRIENSGKFVFACTRLCLQILCLSIEPFVGWCLGLSIVPWCTLFCGQNVCPSIHMSIHPSVRKFFFWHAMEYPVHAFF